MRLQEAIEMVSGLKASTDGRTAEALGYAVVALKEKLEAVQEEAASAATVLRRAIPGKADCLAAWRHLRPLMRLSVEAAAEVEGLLTSSGQDERPLKH